MKHPLEKCNKSQEEFLNKLPEDKRNFHAQLFRIGNASYRYHNLTKEFYPTMEDFRIWLGSLPQHIKLDMEKKGFKECKSILSFTRFVMERNDVGMDKWMQEHLSGDDFNMYSIK